MAAIITEQFRRNSADLLIQDITNPANSYYVGIGQQDEWSEIADTTNIAPYPAGTYLDEERILDHLTGMFRVGGINTAKMIPKNVIETNRQYKVYDPYDPTCFYEDTITNYQPCYVTSAYGDQIYLCIGKNDPDAITAQEESASLGQIGTLSDFGIQTFDDGYTWAYLGRYDRYNEINTRSFVAIGNVTDVSADATSAKASAVVIIPGDDNDIKFIAKTPGAAGNSLTVQFAYNGSADSGSIAVDETSPTLTLITVGPSVTAAEVVNYINNSSPAPSARLDAELSGTGEGLITVDSAETPLTGGATSRAVIKGTTGGLIYGFTILDPGTIYTDNSDPTTGIETILNSEITLIGTDEYGGEKTSTMECNIVINNATGGIVSIIPASYALENIQLEWRHAKVICTGLNLTYLDISPIPTGRQATIIPHIAPINGFGADKTATLPSWYVGLFCDTSNASYIPTGTIYRQISLIRNPENTEGDIMEYDYIQPLRYMSWEEGSGPDTQIPGPNIVTSGWKIVQDGNDVGIISHIQQFERTDGQVSLVPFRYYYYSDHKYGYVKPTTTGGNITFVSPDGLTSYEAQAPAIPDGAGAPDDQQFYAKQTGKVVFVDNRSSITREEGQSEELKLIIQL